MPSNAPFGFLPYRHLTGGLVRAEEFQIASGYASAIYTNSMVKLASDGTIQAAAAGDRTIGSFAGCQFTDATGQFKFMPYWPAGQTLLAGTTCLAMVYADPQITYKVQSGGTPALTNVGNLADLVVGTGSTLTGLSGDYLDSTMGTGSATFRILNIIPEPGNSGQYAVLEVQVVEHELVYFGQATVGV